jgi:hypothetical protein
LPAVGAKRTQAAILDVLLTKYTSLWVDERQESINDQIYRGGEEH